MPPLSEEQLEVRRTGIGSSDVAALAGENPYKSVHAVWLDKRGLIGPSEDTDQAWLGRELEPILGARYAREVGARIVPGPGTVRHPEHPWALATTDFEHEDGSAIVECKVVGWRVEHHWNDSDEEGIPAYVQAQVQWQMGVRGIRNFAVPVLFTSDARFRIFRARFDERLFGALLTIAGRFWFDHVLTGNPPAVDGSEDARTVLSTLYPRPTRQLIVAPPGSYDAARAYQDAKDAEKRAKADASLAGNRLRKFIGDAEGVEGDGWRATWTPDKRGVRSLRVTFKEERAA